MYNLIIFVIDCDVFYIKIRLFDVIMYAFVTLLNNNYNLYGFELKSDNNYINRVFPLYNFNLHLVDVIAMILIYITIVLFTKNLSKHHDVYCNDARTIFYLLWLSTPTIFINTLIYSLMFSIYPRCLINILAFYLK